MPLQAHENSVLAQIVDHVADLFARQRAVLGLARARGAFFCELGGTLYAFALELFHHFLLGLLFQSIKVLGIQVIVQCGKLCERLCTWPHLAQRHGAQSVVS